MDLARAAHREALRDMQPPPAPRTPIPGLTCADAPAPPPRDSIFGQLFTLISRCLRQTMLLEDRFAAGDAPHNTAEPAPRASQPPPAAPAASDATQLHAERLYRETFEDERLQQDTRPAEDILDHIRSELGAASSRLAPRHQTPAPPSRRAIPIIPPGPEPALTALERSVVAYHQTRRPKPPD